MGELIFGISLIFVLGMYIGWILSDWKNTTKYENILKLSTTMMGQSREIWERIVQTKRKEYGVQKRMFNKTPRRIHRNKGGRKKGTIYNKPKKVKYPKEYYKIGGTA